MPLEMTRDVLVARLVRAGELEVSGDDPAETDAHFDIAQFRFHGPGGFEADYPGLTAYFAAFRAAFDDRSIRRGLVVVEGNYVAAENTRAMDESIAHFGTYTVDARGVFTGNRVEGSTFPNWVGDVRTRKELRLVVDGDRMIENFQRPGGTKIVIHWRRVR